MQTVFELRTHVDGRELRCTIQIFGAGVLLATSGPSVPVSLRWDKDSGFTPTSLEGLDSIAVEVVQRALPHLNDLMRDATEGEGCTMCGVTKEKANVFLDGKSGHLCGDCAVQAAGIVAKHRVEKETSLTRQLVEVTTTTIELLKVGKTKEALDLEKTAAAIREELAAFVGKDGAA